MRYTQEYILECIDMYKLGVWPDTPEGIKNPENFHKMIRRWARRENSIGPEAFNHVHKKRTAEEKLSLVSQVLAGDSIQNVAFKAGINAGTLHQWVQKYKLYGYNGLVSKTGRPPKETSMKNNNANPRPLSETEREELLRLRAENEYIKAENEVIKKRIALRQEKWAAQLKAKKQQSSKNFEKKDTS